MLFRNICFLFRFLFLKQSIFKFLHFNYQILATFRNGLIVCFCFYDCVIRDTNDLSQTEWNINDYFHKSENSQFFFSLIYRKRAMHRHIARRQALSPRATIINVSFRFFIRSHWAQSEEKIIGGEQKT